jgi:hypothetical protein
MAAVYECRTCQVLCTEPGELCLPSGVDLRCDYDEDRNEQQLRMCPPMRARTRIECEVCGRPSLRGYLVCLPKEQ